MAKRKDKSSAELEQFEAYGEYTYDFQPVDRPQETEAESTKQYESVRPESSAPVQTVEQVKEKRRKKKTHGFYKFVIVLAVLNIAIAVCYQTMFRLETVYVVGLENKTPQQAVIASGLVKGRNMIGIETQEIAQAFEDDHTLIFKGMQKEYPHTIYLHVEERKVVAVMQWLGVYYTLDKEGVVMGEQHRDTIAQKYPLIMGLRPNNINVGQKLMVKSKKQMDAYLEIMKELQLQMYEDEIKEINLANPNDIYLETSNNVTVRLGDSRYMQAKIGAVRTDMAYLQRLGKENGILDVTTPEDGKYMPDN